MLDCKVIFKTGSLKQKETKLTVKISYRMMKMKLLGEPENE